jgi:hypothetical protein
MSLFRDENPNLGPLTTVKELSGFGTGTPLVSNFKPTTREMVDLQLSIITNPSGTALVGWLYQAPWKCQVIAVHENHSTAAAASTTVDIIRVQADGVAPATANGTTLISVLAAPISLAGTANTRQNVALSVAAGSVFVLNAGDQLCYVINQAPTGLAGCNVQVEIAQIG